jgi:hypothetical protein
LLAGASWFSALDLVSGYWQALMDERDKSKTSFITKYGIYQFEVISCYHQFVANFAAPTKPIRRLKKG